MYLASGILFLARLLVLVGLLAGAGLALAVPLLGRTVWVGERAGFQATWPWLAVAVVALAAAAWVAKGLQEECLRAAVAGDHTRR